MRFQQRMALPKTESAVLIQGASLNTILDMAGERGVELRQKLAQVFTCSKAVILYRATPQTKSRIMQFVAEYRKDANMKQVNSRLLAIGDGANDINMIQQSDIGIGLTGKEISSISAFSDFTIINFKSLHRLLFFHGRRFGNTMAKFLIIMNFKC